MIINRFGDNADDPDMLIFGEGWYQSRSWSRNSDGIITS